MIKHLGIDYGKKRVGIAVSDDGGEIAFPKCILDNNNELVAKVLEFVEKEKIEKIVLGKSLDSNGKPNEIMGDIDKFKKLLEEKGLEVVFEQEQMSSHQASVFFRDISGENLKETDSSAAAIILQSYLDKKNRNQ